ncbi:MAG TPA: hypothetical protein VM433_01010 [Mycobacteriales bacterium]|nr:hypothetical protein [Mycobacteriales bacterium]
MHGLTVRWSLRDTPPGTEQALRDYVAEQSVARFTGMPGLVQKTWQMNDRGFFSGIYIWSTPEARQQFLDGFRANPSAVTKIVGQGPDVIQEWELIGVAVGADGPLTAS